MDNLWGYPRELIALGATVVWCLLWVTVALLIRDKTNE
jgi:hypothetical protein